jgi:hypothetical protein
MYRCDGVRFRNTHRIRSKDIEEVFVGNYVEFSYKPSSLALLKGFDNEGYLIILAGRELTGDELFDLGIRLA